MAGKRAAQGAGTIRKKTVTRNGKQYTYWEARITTGRDPGTGKQIQQSFSGKTQKEVREKMQAAAVEVNTGTYTPPAKMTVGQWLDIWQAEYLGNVKPRTVDLYTGNIRNHIRPALGAIKLSELRPHTVQAFINGLQGLSTGSIRIVYRVLHIALEKAVKLDYIPKNPSNYCVLPKDEKKEIHPLDDGQLSALLQAARGSDIEYIIMVSAFAGLRISEIMGLTWDCIDFENSNIYIKKQLTGRPHVDDNIFNTPKSGYYRTVKAAKTVMDVLKEQQIRQKKQRLAAGIKWNNELNLVFTSDNGGFYTQSKVTHRFKNIAQGAGLEGARFHDLRHTYAVNSIRAGDDIKTLQGNLGHATAAFTLDRYGHFTEQMKKDSASRMEGFINSVFNL